MLTRLQGTVSVNRGIARRKGKNRGGKGKGGKNNRVLKKTKQSTHGRCQEQKAVVITRNLTNGAKPDREEDVTPLQTPSSDIKLRRARCARGRLGLPRQCRMSGSTRKRMPQCQGRLPKHWRGAWRQTPEKRSFVMAGRGTGHNPGKELAPGKAPQTPGRLSDSASSPRPPAGPVPRGAAQRRRGAGPGARAERAEGAGIRSRAGRAKRGACARPGPGSLFSGRGRRRREVVSAVFGAAGGWRWWRLGSRGRSRAGARGAAAPRGPGLAALFTFQRGGSGTAASVAGPGRALFFLRGSSRSWPSVHAGLRRGAGAAGGAWADNGGGLFVGVTGGAAGSAPSSSSSPGGGQQPRPWAALATRPSVRGGANVAVGSHICAELPWPCL